MINCSTKPLYRRSYHCRVRRIKKEPTARAISRSRICSLWTRRRSLPSLRVTSKRMRKVGCCLFLQRIRPTIARVSHIYLINMLCLIECCWCLCCLPYYMLCCCLCWKEKEFSARKPDFIKRFTRWIPDGRHVQEMMEATSKDPIPVLI